MKETWAGAGQNGMCFFFHVGFNEENNSRRQNDQFPCKFQWKVKEPRSGTAVETMCLISVSSSIEKEDNPSGAADDGI